MANVNFAEEIFVRTAYEKGDIAALKRFAERKRKETTAFRFVFAVLLSVSLSILAAKTDIHISISK